MAAAGLPTFLCLPPWALLPAACAHRAAAAPALPLLRTFEPGAPERAASLGRSGSGSASHYQGWAASATAESWAWSRCRRRNIHWNGVEGERRLSLSETRLDRRKGSWALCAGASGWVHLHGWDSGHRRLPNGRFVRGHLRLGGLPRCSELQLRGGIHLVGSVVCWMNRASSSAWASMTFYNSGTADLWQIAGPVNPFPVKPTTVRAGTNVTMTDKGDILSK